MIFKPELAAKILSGEKRQTRRLVHADEFALRLDDPDTSALPEERGPFLAVMTPDGKCRYDVGKTYAVCPGRGKKAIGRIRITSIMREDVRNISEADACAEGFGAYVYPVPAFLGFWIERYDKEALQFLRAEREINEASNWRAYVATRPAALYDAWKLTFEVINANEQSSLSERLGADRRRNSYPRGQSL